MITQGLCLSSERRQLSGTMNVTGIVTFAALFGALYLMSFAKNKNVVNADGPVTPFSVEAFVRSANALIQFTQSMPRSWVAIGVLGCMAAGWGYAYANKLTSGQVCFAGGAFWLLEDSPFREPLRRFGHFFFPLRGNSFHRFFLCPLMLFQELSFLENNIGTLHCLVVFVLSLLLGEVASGLLLPLECECGPESAMAVMGGLLFVLNPKIFTEALHDPLCKLDFPIEVRWVFLCVAFLASFGLPFERAGVLGVGALLGVAVAARWPSTVWGCAQAVKEGGAPLRRVMVFVGLFYLCALFLPFSLWKAPTFREVKAFASGSHWSSLEEWDRLLPSSPSFVNILATSNAAMFTQRMAKLGMAVSPEDAAAAAGADPPALFLFAARIALVLPAAALLSGVFDILKFSGFITFFALLSAMNSPAWTLPHFGFVGLVCCAVSFFFLPQAMNRHIESVRREKKAAKGF
uniref:Uncharacterized protein n=1 Tax=Chromera velia CCMP2878 TaxID=1169474 RepID=A0A0G4HUJ6_9ALVE|eukprot:Cvel_8650.t1-p1 / transcript=Cvel_8650.t1 / gene=Cvel_8650 / organism=Chromera_velia_CCMP2878 / gene_product=hypothetical protein / transcript_product=hypothetical protein / location=Cvel_scaffold482:29542-34933(-) / protein_length=461 / sequence_SO=supercontig / SO=protein_coding / is_pseudo=false